jgi:BON domain
MDNPTEKIDAELKEKAIAELQDEWSIKVRNISILVQAETVTLNGYVSSYVEKLEAVQAVKRVVGIKAITDNIKIQQSYFYYLTEREIAAISIHQVDWATFSPPGNLLAVPKVWINDLKTRWRGLKKASQSASYGTYEVSERYLICSR